MKAYWRNGCTALHILNITRWKEVVSFTVWLLSPQGWSKIF